MAVSINTIKDFSSLVSQLGIEIPLIQRDYVQGRIHDTEEIKERKDDQARELLKKYTDEKEKRDAFVKKLVAALLNPQTPAMQLTFMYGTIEHITGSTLHHSDSFIPLDGQQRLTTLFLLSWVLLNIVSDEGKSTIKCHPRYEEFIKGLQSFNYKTRPSSGNFCSGLFSESLAEVENESTLSGKITKQSWFGEDWKLDPSVQAMLQMIDQIGEEISKHTSEEVLTMCTNLLDGKGIEFELLDMKDYHLTDSLYIKMNARGKQLTKFENWKSEFIGFLDNNHKDVPYSFASSEIKDVFKGEIPTLKQYFEYSIEHQWTDLFWPYCTNEIKANDQRLKSIPNPSKKDKDCYPIIDGYFMTCFYAIHQCLYFIENHSEEPKEFQDTVAQRETTFKNKDNVIWLFRCLDLLKEFNDKNIYKELFYVAEGNQGEHPADLVRLFDGREELNLLTRCAKNQDFTNIVEIILYGMLLYADRFGTQVTVEFKSFVRSVRNIVEGQTFLRKSDVAMTNTLKITQINSIIKDINALLDKAVAGNLLKVSLEYAEIDDMDFTLGNMKPNFLPKENDVVPTIPLGTLRDVLKFWDALAEYDKISILVAYGFRGHYILTCAKGDAYLLGKDKRWRTIFMKNEGLEQVLRDIIADYIILTKEGVTGVDALHTLLARKRASSSSTFDFKYYVLNHKEFTYSHAKWKDASMYYAIRGNCDCLDICSIQHAAQPIRAYYSHPVVFAVKEGLYKQNKGKDKLFIGYSTRGGGDATLDIYETKTWDGQKAIAKLTHIPGIHGNGGWKYDDCRTQKSMLYKDSPEQDRIVAGINLIAYHFPDNDFDEKG